MRIVVDVSDTMARLGQVAIWSFELEAWGECAQAATEAEARASFARRIGCAADDLEVHERIAGADAVFAADLLPADDAQILRTIQILDAQRVLTLALLNATSDDDLDAQDPAVRPPAWMVWRTPREILRHIADTEARAYPRGCVACHSWSPSMICAKNSLTQLVMSARSSTPCQGRFEQSTAGRCGRQSSFSAAWLGTNASS